jgi:hypothetical protein
MFGNAHDAFLNEDSREMHGPGGDSRCACGLAAILPWEFAEGLAGV